MIQQIQIQVAIQVVVKKQALRAVSFKIQAPSFGLFQKRTIPLIHKQLIPPRFVEVLHMTHVQIQ